MYLVCYCFVIGSRYRHKVHLALFNKNDLLIYYNFNNMIHEQANNKRPVVQRLFASIDINNINVSMSVVRYNHNAF